MPFIQTAFLGNENEDVLHFGAVRFRIVGVGDLGMAFANLGSNFPLMYDATNTEVLKSLTMAPITGVEPTRLSNFKSQRASLFLATSQINEQVKINRIIIYTKPIYATTPG